MKQDQEGGDGALNIQAGRDVTIHGVSYSEAKEIALEVFSNNAAQLAAIAKEAGRVRAEELTDAFLKSLQERNPEGLRKTVEPDFQLALLDAQKAYARTGDRDLGRVLVDLLVARSAENTRTLREIVLTESLQVVPRLTPQQINTISVVFILKYTRSYAVISMDTLRSWFAQCVLPFIPSLTKAASCYQHLAYSSAATIEVVSVRLGGILRNTYPGLFSMGHPKEDYQKYIDKYPALQGLLVSSPWIPDNIQLLPLFEEQIREQLIKISIPKNVQDELWEKLQESRKPEEDVEKIASESIAGFRDFLDIWTNSALKQLKLTSVGLAIGHGNYVRISGDVAPLSIWISD